MRTFIYIEPAADGVTPVEVRVTEEDIWRDHWPVWQKRMTELKRNSLFEQCVQDFCAVYWADEIKQDTPE